MTRALRELTDGYGADAAEVIADAVFDQDYDEMVVVKDIPFYSLCEHHMLPFFGTCHVGYLPKGKVVGLSKIPRLVGVFAHRLQLQERLTKEIAEALNGALAPNGVGVVVEARHLCMEMRGVQKTGRSADHVVHARHVPPRRPHAGGVPGPGPPGLAQAEQLLGVAAVDGVTAAAGEVCGLLAVGKVQLSASTAIADSPNNVRNLRLRLTAAHNGPGPNSANPAIGKAAPTMAAAISVSAQPPVPLGGSIAAGHALADGDGHPAVTAPGGQFGLAAVLGEVDGGVDLTGEGGGGGRLEGVGFGGGGGGETIV